MDQAKFWDGVAEKYAAAPIADMAAYEYTLERVRSYLGRSDRVLEIGCGTGSTALLLADSVGEILASDIAPRMVATGERKAAEQGIANVRFKTAAPRDIGPGEGMFDAVLAFNVLHLVEEAEADIAHLATRLKPGGLFISKTFHVPPRGESLKSRAMRLVLPVLQALGKAPRVRIFRSGDLEAMMEGQGLAIVETGSYPADRRFIVARKT